MRALLRLLVIALLSAAGLALGVVALAIPVEALVNHGATSKANACPTSTPRCPNAPSSMPLTAACWPPCTATENRSPVTIDQVPAQVINAVLDTEDARFWTHGGVDLKSTVRALASNVKSGARGPGRLDHHPAAGQERLPDPAEAPRPQDQGGGDRRPAGRRKYTKSQILQAYLNTVYFGNGAYGVQAAAETVLQREHPARSRPSRAPSWPA